MATITRPWVGTNQSEKALSLGYDSDAENRYVPASAVESDIEQPLDPNGRYLHGPPTIPVQPPSLAMLETQLARNHPEFGGMISEKSKHVPGAEGSKRGIKSESLKFESGSSGRGGAREVPGGRLPDGQFNPKSFTFWLVILSNFLAIFLVAIDRTILATAIPTITNEFDSQDDIGWYAAGYMLTGAASQLFFGRVYRFYDLKWYVQFLFYLSCPVPSHM